MDKPLLVLIADDYEGVADMLTMLLETIVGCETLTVVNGAEAVDAAMARKPQAVILDIDMPVMSGIDAAWAIRTRLQAHPPMLIAMTGGVSLAKVRASGAFDHAFQKLADIEAVTDIMGRLKAA